jgi:thioredoxin 1
MERLPALNWGEILPESESMTDTRNGSPAVPYWIPVLILMLVPALAIGDPGNPKAYPRMGRIALVELGADFCAPCRVMKPVLVKLEKAYRGKADIVQIDVVEHRSAMSRFGVRAIPTLIFFDEDGKEVKRHLGIMEEAAIIRQLEQMGIAPPYNPQSNDGENRPTG